MSHPRALHAQARGDDVKRQHVMVTVVVIKDCISLSCSAGMFSNVPHSLLDVSRFNILNLNCFSMALWITWWHSSSCVRAGDYRGMVKAGNIVILMVLEDDVTDSDEEPAFRFGWNTNISIFDEMCVRNCQRVVSQVVRAGGRLGWTELSAEWIKKERAVQLLVEVVNSAPQHFNINGDENWKGHL